jgi:hypothetical protein
MAASRAASADRPAWNAITPAGKNASAKSNAKRPRID